MKRYKQLRRRLLVAFRRLRNAGRTDDAWHVWADWSLWADTHV